MKYTILLLLYAVNVLAFYFNHLPNKNPKRTLIPSTECVYDEKWAPSGKCIIQDDVTRCTSGVGSQRMVKKVLTQSTGTIPRCQDKYKTEECVDRSQCTLLPDWQNINADVVYPNALMSYIGSYKTFSTQSNDLNSCTYYCNEKGGNMAMISKESMLSSKPSDGEDISTINASDMNDMCTCWTLAGDINSVLKVDDENPTYVFDEDNQTILKYEPPYKGTQLNQPFTNREKTNNNKLSIKNIQNVLPDVMA